MPNKLQTAKRGKPNQRARVRAPNFIGHVDKVRILAYPFRQKMTVIDSVIKSVRWTEEAERLASVEAEITFYNVTHPDSTNESFSTKILAPGTWIRIQYLDPLRQTWVDLGPHLYVWERGSTDLNTREAHVKAFDIISFLHNQDEQNWFFKADSTHKDGWYAHQIGNSILRELEIPSRITKTKRKIPYLYLQNHTPFEALMKAYTRDRELTNTNYRIQAVGRTLTIFPFTQQRKTWSITDQEAIIESNRSESLDGLKTEVIVISVTDGTEQVQAIAQSTNDAGNNAATTTASDGTQTPQSNPNSMPISNAGARAISPLISRYGRIRDVIYLEKNVSGKVLKLFAKESLKYVDKLNQDINLTIRGLVPMRAGDAVYVRDKGTRLSGKYFVKSVTQTIKSGEHTAELELSTSSIVPTYYPSEDELTEADAAMPILGSRSVQGPMGVAWYPPFGARTFNVTKGPNTGPHGSGSTWMQKSAMDIQIQAGAPVYACFNGSIRGLQRGGGGHTGAGYSFMIQADSDNRGPTAYYANVASIEPGMKNGKTVLLGDKIGTTGTTPIHFALSKKVFNITGAAAGIDPRPFVNPTTDAEAGGNTQNASEGPNAVTMPIGSPNADVINNWIKTLTPNSPMKGLGPEFAQYSQQNNIKAAFLVALAEAETSLGTQGTGRVGQYNPFGFMSLNNFTNYREPIRRVAVLIGGPSYFGEGRTTIAKIIQKYSPVGVSNDPLGTNAGHPANIAAIMNRLGYPGGVNQDVRLNRS